MAQIGTVYTKTITATADTPFQVEVAGDNYLTSINIHCYTNPSYYGSEAYQQGILQPNSVVWFDGIIKVSDLWFKNYTAGSNTVITITGIIAKKG